MKFADIYYDEEQQILFAKPLRNFSAGEMKILLEEMAEKLEDKERRCLVADVSLVPTLQLNRETRKLLQEQGKRLALEMMAIVGASPITRMLAKIVTTVLGIRNTSRFFKTTDEALAWLKISYTLKVGYM